MFLSRVEIDYHNHQKVRELTHLGAYHNWVESSFPSEQNQGIRLRHLWRIDKLGNHDYLLVVSQAPPDSVALAKYGVEGTAETKDYKPFLDQLAEGQLLRFRLTANPTTSIKSEHQSRGRVVPHVTTQQQLDWLISRAANHGFSIGSVELVERDYPILRHKNNPAVKLSRVSFEGILQVTDVAQLRLALQTGIGREKAYGMGLLTVIPISHDE